MAFGDAVAAVQMGHRLQISEDRVDVTDHTVEAFGEVFEIRATTRRTGE